MLLTRIPLLDQLLENHANELGKDFTAYRNHTYRVVNLCVAFSSDRDTQLDKIATAAAFHDLGIWTDRTFDYLEPSVKQACAHLTHTGQEEWNPEIVRMIREHHKISSARDDKHQLVEPFRRADWVDVSKGLITFGLPRGLVREILSTWPSAGFHKRLVELAFSRFRQHPLSPLPMLKI